MLQVLIYLFLGLLVFAFLMHTIVRIVRHFYKFPMPEFFANIIDNPLRRKIQPPSEMPIRHEIEPGMTVLEVGPGNGTYTVATARRVENNGKVITVDIEPKMIERVTRRTQVEGISNIEARVANVYALPFEDSTFDVVYMIAVISEIPEPARAMKEFYRVLTSTGRLVFSELLFDPDYPLAQTLIRKANSVNFRLKRKIGNFFSYTLIFEKNIQQNTAQQHVLRTGRQDCPDRAVQPGSFVRIVPQTWGVAADRLTQNRQAGLPGQSCAARFFRQDCPPDMGSCSRPPSARVCAAGLAINRSG